MNSIGQNRLPNTGVEAHSCATLVMAFNTGGLPDIVAHQRTDYLAKAFETEALARGTAWVLAQRETGRLREKARERAVERFATSVVAERYQRVYAQAASA